MQLEAFKPAPKRRGRKSKKAQEAFADGGVIDIPQEPEPDGSDMVVVDPETGSVEISHDDGSITIDPTGASLWQKPDGEESFSENLALKIESLELARISEELLTAIAADKSDRSQWESMRAKCIELLGLKLEDPKGDVSRSALGVTTSVVRDPILLEAVERFRANAYAELCPSAGPVKVVNWADDKADTEGLAESLQKDLNYYLTTTASEYYPDTRFMLWWTGLASGTFKKVYKCPLRNRPVSEYVDGTDLIVPANATDLKNSPRVTHEVSMPRDIMRAMQLEGVYRDIALTEPLQPQQNAVELKKANIEGKASQAQRTEDQEYTVYECYCKLDIKGYEHEKDGKPTGLPLPYRVTIDETSREVLEIRRNWDEEDSEEIYRQPHIPFVLFPYSTGISRIYGSGLGQMMGNMASALTALLRISIDNGMMSNYPGLLKAKGTGRQLQNEIMVPPGGVAEIDTGGLRIQDSVMGMPFKDVSQAVVALIEQTRAVAQRLGGTADIPVGEGKQDAPVGTTLAMIEQATKVEGSVHKALHAAQSEEFRLLVKLFRDDPEALWRGNRRPAMGNAQDDAARAARIEKFKKALENCDIQPMADPNVPSGMHRNLMAMGWKQFTAGNPSYDQLKVDRYVAKQMFKMGDNDFNSMLAPAGGPPQPDPLLLAQVQLEERKVGVMEARVSLDAEKVKIDMQRAMSDAQNKMADRESRENIEHLKIASQHAALPDAPDMPEGPDPLKAAELALKAAQVRQKDAEIAFKSANAQADRVSKETLEALKLSSAIAVHPGSDQIVDEQLQQMSGFLSPAKDNGAGGGMSDGGRVGYAFGGGVPPMFGPTMFGGSYTAGLPQDAGQAAANAGSNAAGSAPWNSAFGSSPYAAKPQVMPGNRPPPLPAQNGAPPPVDQYAQQPVGNQPEPMPPSSQSAGILQPAVMPLNNAPVKQMESRPAPLPAPFATPVALSGGTVQQPIEQRAEPVYNSLTVPRADVAQDNYGWQPGKSLSSSSASSGYAPQQYENYADGGSVRGPMRDTDSVRLALALARAIQDRNQSPYLQ